MMFDIKNELNKYPELELKIWSIDCNEDDLVEYMEMYNHISLKDIDFNNLKTHIFFKNNSIYKNSIISIDNSKEVIGNIYYDFSVGKILYFNGTEWV